MLEALLLFSSYDTSLADASADLADRWSDTDVCSHV